MGRYVRGGRSGRLAAWGWPAHGISETCFESSARRSTRSATNVAARPLHGHLVFPFAPFAYFVVSLMIGGDGIEKPGEVPAEPQTNGKEGPV